MSRLMAALFLVATLALTLAGLAHAKGIDGARVCGSSGCTAINDPDRLHELPFGGEATTAAPAPSGFFTVEFDLVMDEPTAYAMYYVPAANAVGANALQPGSLSWFSISDPAADALREAVTTLEPFPRTTGWPRELKSPGRVPAPLPAADEGSGYWTYVASALVAAVLALALGLAWRERRTARPGSRPGLIRRGLLLLCALVVAAGCGGDDETLTVYLKQRLGPQGPHSQIAPVLMPVEREPRDGIPRGHQAVLELRVGPSPAERGQGVLDTVDPETRLKSVTIGAATATVELAGREPDVYSTAAIVYSLTALPGVERVALRLDGKACCAYRHDGTPIPSLSRRAYRGWQGEPCAERDRPDAVRCRG